MASQRLTTPLAMQWVFSADTGGISPAYKTVAE